MEPDISGWSEDTTPPPRAAKSRRPGAKVTTFGDMANQLGLHWNYLSLANYACSKNNPCRQARGEPVLPVDQCQEHLALEWCRGRDCSRPFLGDPPYDDPCRLDIVQRTCEQLSQPIRCTGLRDLGLVLRPTDWPTGDLPPDRWQLNGFGRTPR